MQENGSGNKIGYCSLQKHTIFFRNRRVTVERKNDWNLVPKLTLSALWCEEVPHQTMLYETHDIGRLILIHNVHNRHVLAEQLYCFTDGECKVPGAVEVNNLDRINQPALKKALVELRGAPRKD